MPYSENLWCHEPERLRAYLDMIARASDDALAAAAIAWGSREETSILSIENGIARISISGTLSKRPSILSWFMGGGSTSYDDILGALGKVNADPSVTELRLLIDSPGGNVNGLDDVWLAVRALDSRITVIAENRGLMASGAYWIATAASRIIASSRAAETGSIGVQMVTYDFSEMDKRDGIREIRIISSNAPKKNPDPATEDGRAVYQAELDALERIFISRVADGRKVKPETVIADFGQGGLLVAFDPDSSKPSAFKAGMLDEVMGEPAGSKKQKMYSEKTGATMKNDGEPLGSENNIENNRGNEMPDNLKDFLSANAAASAEVEAREEAARKRGREEQEAASKKRNARAVATLKADYPQAICELALRVIEGEAEPAALDGALAVIDSQREAEAAAAAEAETKKQGSTPAAGPEAPSANGEIATEEDHKAAVARLRAL